jgi:PAS domain S-box-containing protein
MRDAMSDTGREPESGYYKEGLWTFAREAIDQAILFLDATGVVRWAGLGAERILGMPVDELPGTPVERFFTPEDRQAGIPSYELEVARRQGRAEDNRWMMRADGARFWAAGSTVTLTGAAGEVTGFVKEFRNLTDIKMRITTLRNRVAQRDAAIATLSHELRNPLSTLRMVESLLRKGAAGEERLLGPIDTLGRNIDFATRLIEDLENASRSGSGRLQIHPESIQLEELLRECIDTTWARARSPDRHIELVLPSEPITFEADPLRIRQVFANLIGNAIKYTRDGGRIWIKGSVHGPRLIVRIEDDGVGIAPDMLERIFDMFTQAPGPSSREGLGIGLALVKNIVELHGGTVEARSDGPGKGSIFSTWLPMKQA